MRQVTFISAYYENPKMLEVQLKNMSLYPVEVKDNLSVIFVDDGSPNLPAKPVFEKFAYDTGITDIRLYRTLVDVPWNQDFCRNLAVSQANTEWLFLTDIDHIVPGNTLQSIINAPDIYESIAYRFARVTAPDMAEYKPHPNTWFLAKAMYQISGGYDESLAGYYGTDGDFAKRLGRYAGISQRKEVITRIPREFIPDASTTRYERKNEHDPDRKSRIQKARNEVDNWKPLNLSFPWERVC